MTTSLTRRRFLTSTGAAAAGITVSVALPGCSLVPALPTRSAPTPEDARAWLRLAPDGHFSFCSPRQEIGQGISSSLRLIIAEELGVPPERIAFETGTTDRIPPAKSTVGSESIADFAEPTARAAARMRETLRERAADHLSVPTTDLTQTQEGFQNTHGQSVSFATLATGIDLHLAADHHDEAALRTFGNDPKHYVGRGAPTARIEDIITGRPLYAGDVRLPGMAYGAFLRPDRLGAELDRVSFAKITAPTLLQHHQHGNAALVTPTYGDLLRALGQTETVWTTKEPVTETDIEETLSLIDADSGLEHVLHDGEVDDRTPWDGDITLKTPFAAHAAIEPRVAVARWNEARPRLEVWTGTQDAFFVRAHLAKEFGLAEEDVRVHSQRVGGAFGGKSLCNVEYEAAVLAQLADRPVKVQWTRPEEFQTGFHRPPTHHRIRYRQDEDGRIRDWSHRFKSGHVIFTSAAMPPWMQAVTSLTSDPGSARGAIPPYRFAETDIQFSDMRLPVDTGPWRGLGAAPNTLAVELAMDHAAQRAGIDPIDYRLAHLPAQHQRLRACLIRARQLARWSNPSQETGRILGVACGIYKETSYAAAIADLREGPGGTLSVERLFCVQDSGQIINPDQVKAQIEGNIMWGLGMVTLERLNVADGRLDADYLGEYQIPTMADAPDMVIDLLAPEGAPPAGAGETAIVATGAAIANAVQRFRGEPVGSVPLTL